VFSLASSRCVDCGRVINPDIVKAQMEGGIIFGLTAALKTEITLKSGRVQQHNFHDYPMLRIFETPEIEVHIMPSEENPTGVGEPSVPAVAPALTNAIFAATGKRIRRLPIRAGELAESSEVKSRFCIPQEINLVQLSQLSLRSVFHFR
jgi:isoquinoline 1-oxidoreductase beta subunit